MSKTFIKKSYPVEKNVYSSTTIPDNFKDEIRKLATSGDYGKLKEKLTSIPINISFYENDISTSLLHSMIQSDLTEQQKNVIVSYLLEKGVSVNVLDGDNLPPIYYAIKLHLTTIVESLIKYGANLSLSLPKGFDLFTTSLIPFETKCPTQLFNIQDSAYFNKYYNQSLDIEKDIKQKIYNLPFTSNIIKYLLSLCKNLPNDSLSVFEDTEESISGLYETSGSSRTSSTSGSSRTSSTSGSSGSSGSSDRRREVSANPNEVDNIREESEVALEAAPEVAPEVALEAAPEVQVGGGNVFQIFTTLLNEEYKSKLPLFNNALNKFVSNINQELSEQIKLQTVNIDQLILKQSELVSKIVVQIENMLELNKVKKYPEINFEGVTEDDINFEKLNRNIYNQIYRFGNNSIDNLDTNIIQFYTNKIKNIRDIILDYKEKILKAFDTLMTTESNLFKLYSIISGLEREYLIVDISYNKILETFNYFEERINELRRNPKVTLEDYKLDFRKNIFYYNAIIQYVNHIIIDSNIDLSIDEINFDELNPSNQKMLDNLKKYKNEFNDNYDLILDIQQSILVEYDKNIRQFNNFIIDYNNITEIKQLLNYFGVIRSTDNKLKKYYYNYLPLYIDEDSNLEEINNILNQLDYKIDILDINIYRKIVSTGETLGLTHLFIISELFHNKIFSEIITKKYFNELKQKLKEKNKNINDTVLNKLILKSINDAIISAFNEILEIVIYNASTFIINQLLFKDVKKVEPKLEQDLKSRLERRITFQSNTENRKFYLNENYSNSEPIDVILCLNNKNLLIVLLKSKLSVNLREYQNLLFKLGDVELINNLNELTNKKITKLDITMYISNHDKKFDSDIKYLNDQLDNDIIKQSLEFIKGTSKIEFTSEDRRKTIYGEDIDNIYDDMIGEQKIVNKYLTKKIKEYLLYNFNGRIVPLIKEFLDKLVDISVSKVLDTESSVGQEIISNTIDNIITFHLKVDPLKSKDKNMSLNEILTKFNTSFIFNFDDPIQKQNIKSIYDEKLNDKLTTYIMLISQYGLNIYRNQLRYIFNTARYIQIEKNLK
jgi:hypothetical protein